MHMIQNPCPVAEYGVGDHVSPRFGESLLAFKIAVVTDSGSDQKFCEVDSAEVVYVLGIIVARRPGIDLDDKEIPVFGKIALNVVVSDPDSGLLQDSLHCFFDAPGFLFRQFGGVDIINGTQRGSFNSVAVSETVPYNLITQQKYIQFSCPERFMLYEFLHTDAAVSGIGGSLGKGRF